MRTLRVLFVLVLAIVWTGPAYAGQAIDATLTVSDARPGATGVIYSWDLEIKAPIRASSIRVTLPKDASGSPAVYLVDGLPGGSLMSQQGSVGYTFAPTDFSAGHRLIFAVGGVSNPTVGQDFSSEISLGETTATAQPISFDPGAGTRALVFVTAEAARLTRDAPAPSIDASSPVLMTNEQDAIPTGFHPTAADPTSIWALAALLLVSMLGLTLRKTIQIA